MGIRVHKVLGYGLTDVEHEQHRITDPRINTDSKLLVSPWDVPAEEYRDWLEAKNGTEIVAGRLNLDQYVGRDERDAREYRMENTCIHRAEYGLANVLVLKPLTIRGWYRYDDAIDYVEETYLRRERQESQTNRVEVLEHGIYPFNAMYMDKRTGEKLPHEIMWWIRARSRMQEAAAAGEEPPLTPQQLDMLAKTLGFENAAEAVENVRPVVPEEIRDLAEFGELFTSDDVVLQLRPLLYVFWS